MPTWKKNLYVCWFGMFITSIGLSQIVPILPLYINQLGINSPELVAEYSGLAFGITFIVSAIVSPFWGMAADKYGRKIMLLRASFGMAIIVFCTAFVSNVYELILLRMLQGTVTGFATACTILIATQTAKEHSGWALGTLSTATITGSLFGPTIGGYLGGKFGFQATFIITGTLLMFSFLITLIFVKENFVRKNRKSIKPKDAWNLLPDKALTFSLFTSFFVIHMALYSIEPIVTLYVAQLAINESHVAVLSGLVFSISGLANIIAAPKLGKISDKIGAHKVLIASIIFAGIVFIPQAFVTNIWQLMFLRFLLGLSVAGLAPSINILIKKTTPETITGTIFGFNMSARFLGICFGAVIGGQIASHFGIRAVFFATSILLLINAIVIYFRVFKKLNSKSKAFE